MIIRPENQGDISEIFKIHTEAFSSDDEGYLVDSLRKAAVPMISLVAEEKGALTGHILFTPVSFIDPTPGIALAGLGPMAVSPSWQRKGVGAGLIEEGLKHCREFGYDAVVVLGYADYYSRFGFTPSPEYGIYSTYDVPFDMFMVKELKKGSLKGVQGTISYHALFNAVP